MKKIIGVIILVVLVSASGCKQQGQQQKGQAPYPGAAMVSPEQIRHLEQLASQAPKNPEAWTMLGNALMDSQRFSEAAEAYQKSLALDPKNTNVRVDMGTCYRNSGRPQQAVEAYTTALKIDPNHLNANRNLGVVLAFDLNDKKGAVKAFEKYLQLAPMVPDADKLRQIVQDLKAGK